MAQRLIHTVCGTPVVQLAPIMKGNQLVYQNECPRCGLIEGASPNLKWEDFNG